MSVEEDQRDRRVPPERHRLEHGLGDERERPLGADHEPPEDLERRVGVEKRAQPVAGRVLDLELAPRRARRARRPRGARPESRSGRAASSGAAAANRSSASGAARVDHGAVGEHERHRAHGPVGVGDDAAAHAARVVGDHAADAGDVGARRIGAELAAVAGEQAVDVSEHDPGLDPHARAAVLDADARCQCRRQSTSTESVCDWPLSDVPPARKTSGVPVLRAHREQPDDVLDVARQSRPPSGSSRYGLASDAYLTRSRRARRAPAPRRARRSARAQRLRACRPATQSGARSRPAAVAAGRCVQRRLSATTTPATSRRDPHLHQPRPVLARRSPRAAPPSARSLPLDTSWACIPYPRATAATSSPGSSSPGAPGDLLEHREPLEDHVLLVAQHEERDRHLVGDRASTAP